MSSANIQTDFYSDDISTKNEFAVLDDSFDVELISQVKDKEFDAIEILVDLARSGKIDPWNLDIIDVYDKYTKRLAELKANNLKLAGRALLFIAVLLKLKSNILEGIDIFDIEKFGEEEDDFMDDDFSGFEGEQMKMPTNNIISFDEVLQRRTSTRLNNSRNVTLKDLIRHLEFYEELEKKRALQSALDKQKRRVRNYSQFSASDIKNLAHEEYIENIVERMRQNLVKILEHEEKIELKELSLLGFDRVSAYLGALFLSARESYEIFQDEFYGKLYVKKAVILPEEDEVEMQLNAG